jgi:hypothetical protein|tara:strand:+ start:1374 stop:1646 length:273 start_codon:yes stop_codon:yes gene_type:complete
MTTVRRELPFRPSTRERLDALEEQLGLLDDMVGFAMRRIAVEVSEPTSALDITDRTERMSVLHAYLRHIRSQTQTNNDPETSETPSPPPS